MLVKIKMKAWFLYAVPTMYFCSLPSLLIQLHQELWTSQADLQEFVNCKMVPNCCTISKILIPLNLDMPLCICLSLRDHQHCIENVYTQFPGRLSLAECNHCSKELVLLWQMYPLQDNNGRTIGIFTGSPRVILLFHSHLEWRSKCFTLVNPIAAYMVDSERW
jgi:hypothetical protein